MQPPQPQQLRRQSHFEDQPAYTQKRSRTAHPNDPPPEISEAKACIGHLFEKATEQAQLFQQVTTRYPRIVENVSFQTNRQKLSSILTHCQKLIQDLVTQPVTTATLILSQREPIIMDTLWLGRLQLTLATIVSELDSGKEQV